MSVLSLPGRLTAIEAPTSLLLVYGVGLALAVLLVLLIGIAAVGLGMYRLGEQAAPQVARDEIARLGGEREEQRRIIRDQAAELRRAYERVGVYKGAAKHMRMVGG